MHRGRGPYIEIGRQDSVVAPRACSSWPYVLGLALLCAFVGGCASASRWSAGPVPAQDAAHVLLASPDPSGLIHEITPAEISSIPIRKRLRPCCAFGSELRARLGPFPVPFYKIPNVIGPSEIGPHTYDSGVMLLRMAQQQAVHKRRIE